MSISCLKECLLFRPKIFTTRTATVASKRAERELQNINFDLTGWNEGSLLEMVVISLELSTKRHSIANGVFQSPVKDPQQLPQLMRQETFDSHGNSFGTKGGSPAWLMVDPPLVRKAEWKITPLKEGLAAAQSVDVAKGSLFTVDQARLALELRPKQLRVGFGLTKEQFCMPEIRKLFHSFDPTSSDNLITLVEEIKKITGREILCFQDMDAINGKNGSHYIFDCRTDEQLGAVGQALGETFSIMVCVSIDATQETLTPEDGMKATLQLYLGTKWQAVKDFFEKKRKDPLFELGSLCTFGNLECLIVSKETYEMITGVSLSGGASSIRLGNIIQKLDAFIAEYPDILKIVAQAPQLHGDANASNLMIQVVNDSLSVFNVDNRPPDIADVMVDVSKLLFSLYGFSAILEGKLDIDLRNLELTSKDKGQSPEFLLRKLKIVREGFISYLKNDLSFLKKVEEIGDTEWEQRVRFFAILQFVKDTRVAFERLNYLEKTPLTMEVDLDQLDDLKQRITMNMLFAGCLFQEFQKSMKSQEALIVP